MSKEEAEMILKVNSLICTLREEENINWSAYEDSKVIEDCINAIGARLYFLKKYVIPEHDKRTLEEFEKLKGLVEKEDKDKLKDLQDTYDLAMEEISRLRKKLGYK